MKIHLRFAVAVAALAFQVPARADAPAVGSAAPAFKLQDQKGYWRSLDQYRGKWVVLYFYPKDDTPGCTTEVCTFRDDVLKLHKAGAEVLGVSLDDIQSHAAFAEKYHVPFPLLSDNTQTTAKAYGVLTYSEKFKMTFAKRETFLIDPAGNVVKHYVDVDPKENSGQVLADLAALKKGV
ncbi:MAG: peroxiredoxin [Rudaea sp.]|uniref:peroxiredoxin n=1 Tax=Rudaea sp. TaxID=2136325 RepID=UPI0039E36477